MKSTACGEDAAKPWHGSSITDVLAGIDADQASRRPIANGHTIWELLLHMTVWTREVASRVRGASPKSPPKDWPEPPLRAGAGGWQSAQDDFAAAQQDLEEAVAAAGAEGMMRWIGDQRDPALGAGLTVGSVVRGIMQHHAYHEGQIALLKKAV